MESICLAWAQQKGLDEVCVTKLLELEPEMMTTVMEGFSPKPGTMNASGLFMGYVRSIQQAQSGAKGKGKSQAPTTITPELREEVLKFVTQWGLDEECTNVLLDQRPQVIVDVMAGFKPKPDTRDIRSLFFGYLKSVSGVSPAGCGKGGAALLENMEEEISTFTQQFGLDEDCVSQLKQQSPSVVRDVMTSFQPKPETQDIRSLFLSFLRSVSISHSGKGKGKGKDGKGSKASVRASPYETSILAANAGLAAVAGMPALGGLAAFNPQMSVFGGQLAGLQPAMALGYGGLGCGLGGLGCLGGLGACGLGCGACGACPGVAGCGACVGGCTTSGTVMQQEVVDFCNLWQLDAQCADYLACQGPEVQREAMENFRPKPGTANVSGLFMGYLNSLVRANRGGKGAR